MDGFDLYIVLWCNSGSAKIRATEWHGRPARLFCFIRYGRDARATLWLVRFSRYSGH
jgi:hypothetical protein